MELTQFGVLLLPLCALFAMSPYRLLQIAFVAAVFGAAAAVIIGGLGLPPALPPAVIFIGYVGLQYLLGARYPGEREAWRLIEPLVITTVYALATAYILPRVFTNAFDVWPQKVGSDYPFAVPLEPSSSNVNQALYLLVNIVFLVAVVLYLTRSQVNFRRLVEAYWIGGLIVVVISFWQAGSRLVGVPFPDDFLYSNPGWAILPEQVVSNVPRINGPFSEPAGLATYLAGIVFSTTWSLIRGHRSRLAAVLLPCALAVLLLSTSTTAYVVLVIGAAILLIYAFMGAPRRVAARILTFGLPVAAIVLIGSVAMASLSPKFSESVQVVVQETLDKQQGSSYQDRTSLDSDSLALLIPSYGLGAGWGSARASSLVPGLLANLGLVGMVPLIWFVVRLNRRMRRVRRLDVAPERRLAIDAMVASVLGVVLAAMLSAPMITSIDFYLCLAVLLGCVARIEYEAVHGASGVAAAGAGLAAA